MLVLMIDSSLVSTEPRLKPFSVMSRRCAGMEMAIPIQGVLEWLMALSFMPKLSIAKKRRRITLWTPPKNGGLLLAFGLWMSAGVFGAGTAERGVVPEVGGWFRP